VFIKREKEQRKDFLLMNVFIHQKEHEKQYTGTATVSEFRPADY